MPATRSTLLCRDSLPHRWLAATAATTAGLAHIPATGHHLQEAPYMGVLFILLTIACLGVAATLLVHNAAVVYIAGAAVCGAAVAGYVLTRLVPFPLLHHDLGHWFDPLGILSVLAETVVVLTAVHAASRAVTRSGPATAADH